MNMSGRDQRFDGVTSVSAIMRWLMDWTEMVLVLDYLSGSGAHQLHCQDPSQLPS
jgi:hypothetical protein